MSLSPSPSSLAPPNASFFYPPSLPPSPPLTSGPVSVFLAGSSSIPSHTATVLVWNESPDFALLRLCPPVRDQHTLQLVRDQFWNGTEPQQQTRVSVLTSFKSNSLLVQLPWKHNQTLGHQGGPIFAIGYEAPPWHGQGNLQLLVTEGLLAKVASCHGDAVILVTSAVVLSGMSGGVIVSGDDGRVLGMIVSNSE